MTNLPLVLLQMNPPQHMMDGWGSGFGMIVMVLIWLLFLVLIVTLIWFLIRKGGKSSSKSDNESSLEILKKRYARGEIDEEEFRRMKKEISE